MKAISLLYHDVVVDNDFESSGFPGAGANVYKLSVDEMAAHLDALAGLSGPQPSSVRELLNGDEKDALRFFLTFDDGGRSAFTHIADLLEKHGWIGHFFITTNYIDSPTFVTTAQIRELWERGHVIGSHSASHPTIMSQCSEEQLTNEWTESVGRLSDIVGESVDTASVPGGYYSRRVATTAAASGIKALFTSEPVKAIQQVDGCYILGRYSLLRGMRAETSVALSSYPASFDQTRQFVYWNVKKAAKAVGGSYYPKLRRMILRSGSGS